MALSPTFRLREGAPPRVSRQPAEPKIAGFETESRTPLSAFYT